MYLDLVVFNGFFKDQNGAHKRLGAIGVEEVEGGIQQTYLAKPEHQNIWYKDRFAFFSGFFKIKMVHTRGCWVQLQWRK